MKEFRQDFLRRMNRSCRLNTCLSRTRRGRRVEEILAVEGGLDTRYGLRRGIHIRIIFLRFLGKFLGKIPGFFSGFISRIFPVYLFSFSGAFYSVSRPEKYERAKRAKAAGKTFSALCGFPTVGFSPIGKRKNSRRDFQGIPLCLLRFTVVFSPDFLGKRESFRIRGKSRRKKRKNRISINSDKISCNFAVTNNGKIHND